jgi:hypothetical protein
MCDYSLQAFKSRPAKVADRLIVRNFKSGTRGFVTADDEFTVVCVLPGTELAFDAPIRTSSTLGFFGTRWNRRKHTTAIFRQVDKHQSHTHHDALELPDGEVIKVTVLDDAQLATVLQLPAAPQTVQEAEEQQRLEPVG